MRSMRTAFEDDKVYEMMFTDGRLNADPRRIVLCYKVQERLGRITPDRCPILIRSSSHRQFANGYQSFPGPGLTPPGGAGGCQPGFVCDLLDAAAKRPQFHSASRAGRFHAEFGSAIRPSELLTKRSAV